MQYKVTSNAAYVNFDGNKTFHITGGAPRIDFPEFSGEKFILQGVYDGIFEPPVLLASGAVVRQFGVKMRNANPCNIAYVMREVYPSSSIIVSIKANPGMTTSAQCGAGGYTGIAKIPVDQIYPGQEYKLAVKYAEGTNTLMVYYNDKPIWLGTVSANWTGVGGYRSDNVRTHFEVS